MAFDLSDLRFCIHWWTYLVYCFYDVHVGLCKLANECLSLFLFSRSKYDDRHDEGKHNECSADDCHRRLDQLGFLWIPHKCVSNAFFFSYPSTSSSVSLSVHGNFKGKFVHCNIWCKNSLFSRCCSFSYLYYIQSLSVCCKNRSFN